MATTDTHVTLMVTLSEREAWLVHDALCREHERLCLESDRVKSERKVGGHRVAAYHEMYEMIGKDIAVVGTLIGKFDIDERR